MPKYRFKAVDENNKKIKGTFLANDDNDLKRIMKNQNYYLISYRKIPESSQTFGFLERIKTRDFTMFCREFAIMLQAGLTLEKTVYFLKKNTRNKKLKGILEVVHEDLLKGLMLSDAFAKYPKTFPSFFRNMVRIGEEAGNLTVVFKKLADYYEDATKLKKKVQAALAYPIFLILLVVAALIVISLVVMPQFKSLFSQFNGELPLVTRIVIAVTDFIKEYFLVMILIVIILIFTFTLLNKNMRFKKAMHGFKITVPLFKRLNIAVITSRFASSFAILLESGMPIIRSMDITAKLINNLVVEEKLMVVKNEIESGGKVSKSVETIGLFPPMLIEMMAVGEETSSLEDVLTRTSSYFEDQVETEIKALTASIQPIMIGIIGLVIATILLAIFIPMLDLMSTIDGAAGRY